MDIKPIVYFAVIALIIIVIIFSPKKEGYKNLKNDHQNGNKDLSCATKIPTGNSSVPVSAIARLSNGLNNNQKSSDIKPDYDYTDKRICATPKELNSITNDTCAQYGIGEMSTGPEGNAHCVCVAEKQKDGSVLIQNGGVCTKNEQCSTGTCHESLGIFSKVCGCPDGKIYNETSKKCECPSGYHHKYHIKESVLSTNGDQNPVCEGDGYDLQTVNGQPKCVFSHCIVDTVQIPDKTCSTTGKICGDNSECSIGEECQGDGYCRCKLTWPEENDVVGTFVAGGLCTSDDQCAKNTKCLKTTKGMGQCGCPAGLYYSDSDGYCKCFESNESPDPLTGKCTKPSDFKRLVCPSNINTPRKDSIKECGLGENWNPTTRKCYCEADTFSGKINTGGRCETSDQCEYGYCISDKHGVKTCSEDPTTNYQLSVGLYSF